MENEYRDKILGISYEAAREVYFEIRRVFIEAIKEEIKMKLNKGYINLSLNEANLNISIETSNQSVHFTFRQDRFYLVNSSGFNITELGCIRNILNTIYTKMFTLNTNFDGDVFDNINTDSFKYL